MKLVVENTPPKINNKYEDLYLSWRWERLKNISRYKNQIETDIKLLKIKGGDKILDVGCAFGFSLMEFANLGFNCSGIEITKEFAQIAGTVSNYFGLRIGIVIGDACHLPYPGNSFDAVMSTEFFSHVADSNKALEEQIRVLKRGGRLLIRDGNILCPLTLYDLLFAFPFRTKGKYGGIKWILTRKRVIQNYLDRGFDGKLEDIKSLYWWKDNLKKYKNLEIDKATTGFAYRHPGITSNIFEPFLGQTLIVIRKTG